MDWYILQWVLLIGYVFYVGNTKRARAYREYKRSSEYKEARKQVRIKRMSSLKQAFNIIFGLVLVIGITFLLSTKEFQIFFAVCVLVLACYDLMK